ncbi:unnamed protein product [Rotaria sp. Silwood2]|nr:unnamed protein product [Rotaria sp. Silwood2]CAF4312287.1 unnamed protein product [Rotaria sp. Silwood2]CAF4345888.1 unnamed protein product [Rotaria sp. Silwood2]
MFDEGFTHLPSRDNMKRRIKKLLFNDNFLISPNNSDFISVSIVLCKALRQTQFLRCDTGPSISFNTFFVTLYIFVVYYSSIGDEQFNILQPIHRGLADGTFKIVSEVFYQLYLIHVIYRDCVVSAICALLRCKDAVIYRRLINKIFKVASQWTPQSMMIVFKRACINVYEQRFPNIVLSDCYFYLRQNLRRKQHVLYYSS